ncbi:UNKNOWN [Stylonychia lemnae]|uniref:Transmembrane protein n=1 Tax=Stylonychia lemnae TaxID=5949 RepID=A0A077ZRQ8_STYLE|nr:UNKNOWN [Stylonychia lemnae]|eukprot:CDW72154.1 UNKNOWN [Stylonychia lemnae]
MQTNKFSESQSLPSAAQYAVFNDWKNEVILNPKSSYKQYIYLLIGCELIHSLISANMMLMEAMIVTLTLTCIFTNELTLLGLLALSPFIIDAAYSLRSIIDYVKNPKNSFNEAINEPLIFDSQGSDEDQEPKDLLSIAIQQFEAKFKLTTQTQFFKDFFLNNYKQNGFHLEGNNLDLQIIGITSILAQIYLSILVFSHSSSINIVCKILLVLYPLTQLHQYFGFQQSKLQHFLLSCFGLCYFASICLGATYLMLLRGSVYNELSFVGYSVFLTVDAFYGVCVFTFQEQYLNQYRNYRILENKMTSILFDNWKSHQFNSMNRLTKIAAFALINLQITFTSTLVISELHNLSFYTLGNPTLLIATASLLYSMQCNIAFFMQKKVSKATNSYVNNQSFLILQVVGAVLSLLLTINLIAIPSIANLVLLTPFLIDSLYGLSVIKEAFDEKESSDVYYASGNFFKLEYSEIPDEKLPALNQFCLI